MNKKRKKMLDKMAGHKCNYCNEYCYKLYQSDYWVRSPIYLCDTCSKHLNKKYNAKMLLVDN